MPLNANYRQAILDRDHKKCAKCKSHNQLEVHHIVMQYLGGNDNPENLITLCAACHQEWHFVSEISTMSFQEWLQIPMYLCLVSWYLALTRIDLRQLSAEQVLTMLQNSVDLIKTSKDLGNETDRH